jgi:ribose transport system substrate-binding protein
MERRTLIKVTAVGLVAGVLPRGRANAAAKYRIGFSQATILETWRVQFNKDMKREAEKHPEIELIIADGQNKTEKQVADVENFISQGVDVLSVSPKESAGLTPVVEKAIDAGIPVIILDRNVNTDRITQFIGGDNVVIGRAAGDHAVKLLGGPGNAKGNVVEIWGGFASAPAHDRSTGFHEVTDKEPGIKYLLAPIDTEWKPAKGYEIMATALQANEKIDLVYAHNDPLAYNAYLASKDAGREKEIKFMGIDGIPNEGVTWVDKGELDATFLYATPGAEGIRQALKLLQGEKIEKQITLPTMTITKDNAADIIKANG